jgi:hypothetical protein
MRLSTTINQLSTADNPFSFFLLVGVGVGVANDKLDTSKNNNDYMTADRKRTYLIV